MFLSYSYIPLLASWAVSFQMVLEISTCKWTTFTPVVIHKIMAF